MIYLRILLLIWLALSVKVNDDLYGVRYSMRQLQVCRKVRHN
jgi:hypothetical protein